MKTMRRGSLLLAFLFLLELPARAQAPLAQPLAEFDKLVAQLKISHAVGEPIRVGDTAVVPFAKIRFALGGGEAMTGFGGGMGGKTEPLGILIVEGDDARLELFPEQEEGPTAVQRLAQAILDRKVVIMGNGLNIGSTSGAIQDLAPLVSAMMGQTTFMGNALNFGALRTPTSAGRASPVELKRLFETRKYAEALAMADVLIVQDPKNADLHEWKGRIMGGLAQGDDAIGYRMGAMEEFGKALALGANDSEVYVGRGVSRLMLPPGSGGDLDGAIADLEAAISSKPSPEAYYNLGEAFQKKGLNDKAVAAYQKAIELQPGYAAASKALAAIKK